MMSSNKKINTSELDFDKIKDNLKSFLSGQEQFKDYDFEGSNLSVLLDVLAYNTHYQGLYLNLAINEVFLDSATKRNSIVSKARELGYIPSSARCAEMLVQVKMLNKNLNAPSFLEIPAGTLFVSKQGPREIYFYTQQSYLAYKNNSQYIFDNVLVKEGQPVQNTYQWLRNQESIIIPNANIDISTLSVIVQDSMQSSENERYYNAVDIANITADSKVFYTSETDNRLYKLEFGNNILGKALNVGNIIYLNYMVSNGSYANGINQVQYSGPNYNGTKVYTNVISAAAGGSFPESIDSIKWAAPRMYTAQNRCVTVDDYKTIIYKLFPSAISINVWGGEQNNPPSYGDVFIAIQPESGNKLSDADKSYILNNILANRKIVTMHPKFVDPQQLLIELNTSIYYNPRITSDIANDIVGYVRNGIKYYEQQNLLRFGSVLKQSNLSTVIDNAHMSISSSITTLKIHYDLLPSFNQQTRYVINLGNPIALSSAIGQSSITSTGVRVLNNPNVIYFEDKPDPNNIGKGIMQMVYYAKEGKIILKTCGTVSYETGTIILEDIIIVGLNDASFKLIIIPESYDVASKNNEIIMIPDNMLFITPIIDMPADSYRFTPSRN